MTAVEELRIERLIAAPPERVFAAFTAPGGQEAFYGKDDPGWIVRSRCELRVGGAWVVDFGPSPAELYRHRHVFAAIEAPGRIVLATTETRLDGSTLTFETEFTFAAEDGGTRMTMVQRGLPTPELRDEHGHGVPRALARFAMTIER
jgi:uncharacterized protein YndB with AHSA1/START domain